MCIGAVEEWPGRDRIETEHDRGAWHQWLGGRNINLTMLESTVSMIEMLPEEDLTVVPGTSVMSVMCHGQGMRKKTGNS